MPEVQLTNLSKSFGDIEAIDGVDLHVENKEYICILGPTGSGKTTLLLLIAGLLSPDKGEIYLNNRLVNKLPSRERNVAYLPQQYALFPHMTVLYNVAFGPSAKGLSHNEAMDKAYRTLEMVKLDHRADAFPKELSGGMQQRVALARALASGADLLLLDEPLGALDARLREDLRYSMKSLVKRAGSTAIHVTHDQREAMIVGDRIVVIRRGRVEQMGSPYHIYRRPTNVFVANFIGETNFLEGVVTSVGQFESKVELLHGPKITVRDTSYLPEESVILSIRQERTGLRDQDWEGVNVLDGVIQAVRFLGDSLRVDVELDENVYLSAIVPLASIVSYPEVGYKVRVTFNPEDTTLFVKPSRELARELEVS